MRWSTFCPCSCADADDMPMGGCMETDTMRKRQMMRAAKANWDAWDIPVARVLDAAREWEKTLRGVERPWLCWSVNDEWSMVQQRLVAAVGWTPLVGFDPRAGRPRLHDNAVLIDFNSAFGLPALHMVFPLEWVFLFAPRLAFWHSDLLVRLPVLESLAEQFAALADGEIAAVDQRTGWWDRLRGRPGRYWELIGCTTRAASRDQFENGCGWWRHISKHPNCPADRGEKARRASYPYDHGAGILYWERHYGGIVRPIVEARVGEGHCTRINKVTYQRLSPDDERRDLSKDLPHNYDLREVCAQLNLSQFL